MSQGGIVGGVFINHEIMPPAWRGKTFYIYKDKENLTCQ